MYKAEVIRAMKEDFCFTQEESVEIHGDTIRMKWFQMLALYCIRLFAPIF